MIAVSPSVGFTNAYLGIYGGGAVSVVVPDVPGIEYSLREIRIHYKLPEERMHYATDE